MANQSTAVFPSTSNVVSGVKYGPTGADFTGTVQSTSTDATEIANIIWAHKLALTTTKFLVLK